MRRSLRMLGYDFVGSLGGSVLHVLEGAPGKRLCEITYPAKLPRTGVPYVERFAADDRQVDNAAIKKEIVFAFTWTLDRRLTMPAMASAISAEAGTLVLARNFRVRCGAR